MQLIDMSNLEEPEEEPQFIMWVIDSYGFVHFEVVSSSD